MEALGDLNADHAALGLLAGTLLALVVFVVRPLRPWAPALAASTMVLTVGVGAVNLGFATVGDPTYGPVEVGIQGAVALLAAIVIVSVPTPSSPIALVAATGLAAAALVVLGLDPGVATATGVIVFVTVPAAVLGGSATAAAVPSRLTAALVVLAFGGMYGGVPDTEWALRVLGVAVPVALLTAGPTGVRTGTELRLHGSAAPLVVLLWVAASSARDGVAPVVGTAGCLGLLLVAPVAARLARRPLPCDGRSTALLAALQVVVVALCSRVAAISGDAVVATVTVVGALACGAACSWLVVRAAPPAPPPR